MKITLISVSLATLLGLALSASGLALHAGDFVALVFTVGLAAWTFRQYSREARPLTSLRPIHLPVHPALRCNGATANRLAA